MDKVDIHFYIEDIFLYYNIQKYCINCVKEQSNIRNRRLRNILINWFLSQKHLAVFTQIDLNSLCDIFKLECLVHNKKTKEDTYFKPGVISFEFTGGPIPSNYVFMGDIEDKKQNTEKVELKPISKPKYKKLRMKKKPKKVLKKKTVIKNII
jgi:hypothetical protein